MGNSTMGNSDHGTTHNGWPILGHLSFTFSVGAPLYPYGIAYRGFYGLSTSGLFKKSLCSPLFGENRRGMH